MFETKNRSQFDVFRRRNLGMKVPKDVPKHQPGRLKKGAWYRTFRNTWGLENHTFWCRVRAIFITNNRGLPSKKASKRGWNFVSGDLGDSKIPAFLTSGGGHLGFANLRCGWKQFQKYSPKWWWKMVIYHCRIRKKTTNETNSTASNTTPMLDLSQASWRILGNALATWEAHWPPQWPSKMPPKKKMRTENRSATKFRCWLVD